MALFEILLSFAQIISYISFLQLFTSLSNITAGAPGMLPTDGNIVSLESPLTMTHLSVREHPCKPQTNEG